MIINESNYIPNSRSGSKYTWKGKTSGAPQFMYNLDKLSQDPNLYGRLMDMSDKELRDILKELGIPGGQMSSYSNKQKKVDKAYELLGGK